MRGQAFESKQQLEPREPVGADGGQDDVARRPVGAVPALSFLPSASPRPSR